MSNLRRCFHLLNENEPAVYKEVSDILLRLCRNVMKNPNELKYRKVRFSNPIVANKILPAIGAMECLFEIGFVEHDDHLLLPQDASLVNLRELHDLLLQPGATKAEVVDVAKPATPIYPTTTPPSQPQNQRSATTTQPASTYTTHETKFFNQIKGYFQDVLQYEKPAQLSRARAVVPIVRLQIAAMEKMRMLQRDIKTNGEEKSVQDISIEDLMLAELLRWFKEDFFQWVDSPKCDKCSGNCKFQNAIASRNPGLSRIELHRCGSCGATVEFPRYSDPALLLHWRKGRCGEWANAFALICRSLGYDVRFIWDYTDHVWVETWSIAGNRWIHADPCEGVMDRPLLYEKGWGKKLSYVLAFSKDEVQDVTWRYTLDQPSVMKRRNFCSENNLLSFITTLTKHRQETSCSAARRSFLVRRSLMELVELITCQFGDKRNENQDDYQGRTSGSLAWRLARQETKMDPHSSHIWRIPESIDTFHLRYMATDDTYVVANGDGKVLEEKKGWNKGIYEMEGGIFRKVETDWKMVYLARAPQSESGKLQWSFELSNSNAEIDRFCLRAVTAVFNKAIIQWKLQGFYRNGKTKVIAISDTNNFETEQLKGSFKISLTVVLSGGEKDLAWQHAQLFRQSLDASEHSMEIRIQLGKII